jgi:sulfite exporter TauE/SafE/copper chaperone CopZ
MKSYTFHVTGMHCNACPVLIKSELEDMPEVTSAVASLMSNTVALNADFGDKTQEHVARDLTEVLNKHGYSVSTEKQQHAAKWSEFSTAIPVAAVFIALFILLQKLGIVNLVTTSNVTFGTAFIIGLVASVSTCMAIVGGLVLSMSASFAKEGDKVRPQMLFHAGRLVSFFLLGGVLGAVGSFFTLGGTGTFVLSLIVALILVVLGVNLLDVFPWMKRITPALPSFFGQHIQGLKTINHSLTPLLVGIATFFLPCGFTQSMQLYALTTGNFLTGALTMFSFALGTLPVLALLSFSSLAIHKKAQSGVFFKTAGMVVIFFGIFNLAGALAAAGIINPLFNF